MKRERNTAISELFGCIVHHCDMDRMGEGEELGEAAQVKMDFLVHVVSCTAALTLALAFEVEFYGLIVVQLVHFALAAG